MNDIERKIPFQQSFATEAQVAFRNDLLDLVHRYRAAQQQDPIAFLAIMSFAFGEVVATINMKGVPRDIINEVIQQNIVKGNHEAAAIVASLARRVN